MSTRQLRTSLSAPPASSCGRSGFRRSASRRRGGCDQPQKEASSRLRLVQGLGKGLEASQGPRAGSGPEVTKRAGEIALIGLLLYFSTRVDPFEIYYHSLLSRSRLQSSGKAGTRIQTRPVVVLARLVWTVGPMHILSRNCDNRSAWLNGNRPPNAAYLFFAPGNMIADSLGVFQRSMHTFRALLSMRFNESSQSVMKGGTASVRLACCGPREAWRSKGRSRGRVECRKSGTASVAGLRKMCKTLPTNEEALTRNKDGGLRVGTCQAGRYGSPAPR